jgi:hypothetical protein
MSSTKSGKRIFSESPNRLRYILSGGEYFFEVDRPADSAFWEYWLEAVEKVKTEGPPPLKVLLCVSCGDSVDVCTCSNNSRSKLYVPDNGKTENPTE